MTRVRGGQQLKPLIGRHIASTTSSPPPRPLPWGGEGPPPPYPPLVPLPSLTFPHRVAHRERGALVKSPTWKLLSSFITGPVSDRRRSCFSAISPSPRSSSDPFPSSILGAPLLPPLVPFLPRLSTPWILYRPRLSNNPLLPPRCRESTDFSWRISSLNPCSPPPLPPLLL